MAKHFKMGSGLYLVIDGETIFYHLPNGDTIGVSKDQLQKILREILNELKS